MEMNVLRIHQPRAWFCATPMLCGLHCLAAPVLTAVMPGLSLSPAGEQWLLGIVSALTISTVAAGMRLHRRAEVGIPVSAGLLLWIGALAGWTGSVPEAVTIGGGSLLLTAGMVWNAGLRHRAADEACACPAC